MIPVPQTWLDEYDAGHAMTPLCIVSYTDPATGATLDQTPTEGTLTRDAGQWPRVTCEFTVPGAITPEITAPPVSPFGGTVVISQGIRTSDGRDLLAVTASLVVTGVAIDRPSGDIVVSAASYEAVVNEDRQDSKSASAAGTGVQLVTTAVQRTLGGTWPVSAAVSADRAFGAGAWQYDGDVWPTIEDITTAVGAEAYFDAGGGLVIRDRPAKTSAPAVTLRVGEHGALTGYSSNRRWAANRVAMVYDDGTNRVVGVWQQNDAASPARVTGPYGRHTAREVITVPAGQLPTAANANAAAKTQAGRSAQRFRSVELRAVPAPWLEPGDTVEVGMFGLTERHLVETVMLPLSGLDVMTVTTVDSTYLGGIT